MIKSERRSLCLSACILGSLLGFVAPALGQKATIEALRTGSYKEIYVSGLSADGSVAAGSELDDAYSAVRWDGAGKLKILPIFGIDTGCGVDVDVRAISRDGRYVIGSSDWCASESPYPLAVRWSPSGAIQRLESLAGADPWTRYEDVQDVSSDGIIAVGFAGDDVGGSRAVRWNESGQPEVLQVLDEKIGEYAYAWGRAEAVSATGAFVAGVAEKWDDGGNSLGYRPVRWNPLGQIEELETPSVDRDGAADASVEGISAGGGFVAGEVQAYTSEGKFDGYRVVRWDEYGAAKTMQSLGKESTLYPNDQCHGMTPNGRYLIGMSCRPRITNGRVTNYYKAVRWTAEDGSVLELPTLSGSRFEDTTVTAISDNGRVMVGSHLWIDGKAYDPLTFLKNGGADVRGWTSLSVHEVSADGKVVAGSGFYNESFYRKPFRARLSRPNVPPVANAGPDIVRSTTSKTGTRIQLNGARSRDADGDKMTYIWSAPKIKFDNNLSVRPTATFPVGTTTVTLRVRDPYGVETRDTLRVVVKLIKRK